MVILYFILCRFVSPNGRIHFTDPIKMANANVGECWVSRYFSTFLQIFPIQTFPYPRRRAAMISLRTRRTVRHIDEKQTGLIAEFCGQMTATGMWANAPDGSLKFSVIDLDSWSILET